MCLASKGRSLFYEILPLVLCVWSSFYPLLRVPINPSWMFVQFPRPLSADLRLPPFLAIVVNYGPSPHSLWDHLPSCVDKIWWLIRGYATLACLWLWRHGKIPEFSCLEATPACASRLEISRPWHFDTGRWIYFSLHYSGLSSHGRIYQ